MDKKEVGLINFKPDRFIEILLKLSNRAKGQQVEVTVKKKKEIKTA